MAAVVVGAGDVFDGGVIGAAGAKRDAEELEAPTPCSTEVELV